MGTKAVNRKKVWEEITERVVAQIESGTVPWRQTWSATAEGSAFPHNAKTGRSYRGVNVFLLWAEAQAAGYRSAGWVTYKQAKELGGQVRRGEKGTHVVFWKILTKATEEGDESSFPMARVYTVFNVDQCDGIELPERPTPACFEPIEAAQELVNAWPVSIVHGGDRCRYNPSQDRIHLPDPGSFLNQGEYYSAAFHEIAHSTGHRSRLGREGVADKVLLRSHTYAREELVAELASCLLCAHTRVSTESTETNSAAYLRAWASKLRDDPKLFMRAAQQAQKAADFVIATAEVQEAATA